MASSTGFVQYDPKAGVLERMEQGKLLMTDDEKRIIRAVSLEATVKGGVPGGVIFGSMSYAFLQRFGPKASYIPVRVGLTAGFGYLFGKSLFTQRAMASRLAQLNEYSPFVVEFLKKQNPEALKNKIIITSKINQPGGSAQRGAWNIGGPAGIPSRTVEGSEDQTDPDNYEGAPASRRGGGSHEELRMRHRIEAYNQAVLEHSNNSKTAATRSDQMDESMNDHGSWDEDDQQEGSGGRRTYEQLRLENRTRGNNFNPLYPRSSESAEQLSNMREQHARRSEILDRPHQDFPSSSSPDSSDSPPSAVRRSSRSNYSRSSDIAGNKYGDVDFR